MAQLFTLLYGRSKKKMRPIMTNIYRKCENYCLARQNVIGFHKIVEAEPEAVVWRQKTATIGGNKDIGGCKNGYISKNGFQPHT